MRSRTLIVMGVALVALLAAWLFWPAPVPPSAPDDAPSAAGLPPASDSAPGAAAVPPPKPLRQGPPLARESVLAGKVLDASGQPAPRAQIFLRMETVDLRADINQGANYELGNRQTDADAAGQFAFAVNPGRYRLMARTPSAATDGFMDVDVPAHARREVILNLVAGLTVRGRTVDPQGAPIEGAHIFAGPATRLDPRFTRYPHWRKPGAVSRADGRWQVTGIQLGPAGLRVSATHANFTDAVTELADPPRDEVLMVMNPRVPGSGAKIMGTVTDESGKPVAGVNVQVQSLEYFDKPEDKRLPGETWYDVMQRTGRKSAYPDQTLTGEDGRFELDAVAPGEKRIVFEADGRLPTGMPGVKLKDGDVVPGVDATLRRGLSVAGQVSDDTGQVLAGAEVEVIGADFREQLFRTGADGRFDAGGLPEGTARVEASLEGHAVTRLEGVPAGQTDLRIVLPRVGSVQGAVRRAGKTADKFKVTIERISSAAPADLSPTVQEIDYDEEAAGQFQLQMDPGTYRFTARAGDAMSPPAPVVVAPGQIARFTLEIP